MDIRRTIPVSMDPEFIIAPIRLAGICQSRIHYQEKTNIHFTITFGLHIISTDNILHTINKSTIEREIHDAAKLFKEIH